VTRIRIRRRSRSAGSITAAATRIVGDPSKAFKSAPVSRGEIGWQDEAWAYLRRVGELQYYVGWRSYAMSRCRLVASEFDEDGLPTGSVSPENARVAQIVRDIAGGLPGQSQLLQRLGIYLSVPGEGWVALIQRDVAREENPDKSPVIIGAAQDGEQWLAVSRKEIATRGGDLYVTLPDGVRHKFNPDTDIMFRVWNPDPEVASNATSSVIATRDILNEIVRATDAIDAASKSRLMGNGIVFVPQEMSLPTQRPPGTQPMPGDAGVDEVPVFEQASAQDLQDLISQVAAVAMKDQNSTAANLPIFATAPGEWIGNVKHLKFDSTVSETALKTRETAIRRFATSVDVSPERLLGLGANSNHWSAWAIGDDDVKIHVAPPMETICQAFTQEVLHEALLAEGFDPTKFCVWYDPAALTQDPDKKDEAATAHEAGALNNQSFLGALGFSDEDGYDLETLAGWQQLARDRASKDPTLIPLLAPLLGADVAGIMAPEPQTALPASPPPTVVEEDPPPKEEPPTEKQAPPPEDAVSAAAMLQRIGVNRALEMANKRRRTRENHALFAGVPIHHAHLRLPRVEERLDGIRKLVDGWDASLGDEVVTAAGLDPVAYRRWVVQTAARCLIFRELP
jgi:hypothetical protein